MDVRPYDEMYGVRDMVKIMHIRIDMEGAESIETRVILHRIPDDKSFVDMIFDRAKEQFKKACDDHRAAQEESDFLLYGK